MTFVYIQLGTITVWLHSCNLIPWWAAVSHYSLLKQVKSEAKHVLPSVYWIQSLKILCHQAKQSSFHQGYSFTCNLQWFNLICFTPKERLNRSRLLTLLSCFLVFCAAVFYKMLPTHLRTFWWAFPVSSTQVSLVPEETLEFQEFQDRVMMEPVGRMVSQVFLGPKVSLVRSWVPHLVHQDWMVYLDFLETRATPAHQEGQDCLVGLRLRNTLAEWFFILK